MTLFSKPNRKRTFLFIAPLAVIFITAGGFLSWRTLQKNSQATIYFTNREIYDAALLIDKPNKEEEKNICENCGYAQILFAGDLMFDRYIRQAAEKKGNNFIFEKVSDFLKNFDLVVVNLEGPITPSASVSIGTEPGSSANYLFTFDPSLAKILFGQNIKLVNLGNNHILNFGQKGLDSTEKYLPEANIGYFGAPNGQQSVIKNIRGIKIAFVSYNQFANDPLKNRKTALAEIKKAKQEAAIVILYAHWGIEYTVNPNNTIKDLARQFIDAGADLIVGSHPHVIEPLEEYKGKRIYYSLGNFIFDQYFNAFVRQGQGVIVKIDAKTKQLDFSEKKFYLESNGQTSIAE